jgi:hypothetical protein
MMAKVRRRSTSVATALCAGLVVGVPSWGRIGMFMAGVDVAVRGFTCKGDLVTIP